MKPATPLESKKYMKKLQVVHREDVAKLLATDENHDEIHRMISEHQRLIEEVHQLSSFCGIIGTRVLRHQ